MGITEKASIFTIAQYGDLEAFKSKFKLEKINEKDNDSGLLHYALAGRKFDISLFLIQNDIDVNMINDNGQTALHYVSMYRNLEIVQAILDKGGDINIRDKYGNNALWTAVFNSKGKYYDIVELFMQYNPDVNTKNKAGRSPLDFAKQVGDEKLIKVLER